MILFIFQFVTTASQDGRDHTETDVTVEELFCLLAYVKSGESFYKNKTKEKPTKLLCEYTRQKSF